ncbi:SMI1/KNR4 family protein [Streptomyces griseosporeus]|uniref:SMI1/KNR4 family protein n=1 Tax=Streptomyces griseosporeus TaxID=1910 RepID=UPI0036FB35A2
MEISRFHELLGLPSVNGDVEYDWRDLETRSGVALPADYKQFVTAYGPGCLNEQLYLFHPRAASDGLRLEELWRQASYAYSELARSAPDMYPYPIYPEVGGLIPVARSMSGNHVLLSLPKAGDRGWSVVLEMGQWIPLNMPFTDFLWQSLTGELGVPLIEGEPLFEPVGAIE